MPTPRKHASHAQRQAAYRRRRQRLEGPCIPAVPGYPRWARMADWTRDLLDGLRWEMHDYSCQRSRRWQESDKADTFLEQLTQVSKTIALMEDLSQDWATLCPTPKRKPRKTDDQFDL